jgi:hypothetical protein
LNEFTMARLLVLFSLSHPDVFWRHDVDFSLECAVRMAGTAHDCGIASTFYLRVDEQEYGLGDMAETAAILANLGHRVGVHLVLGLPRTALVSDGFLARLASREVRKAQREASLILPLVSLHSPPHSARWREIDGFENAMEPEWESRYISDARGVMHGEPEVRLAMGDRIQINLHPEWWFLPEPDRHKLQRLEMTRP